MITVSVQNPGMTVTAAGGAVAVTAAPQSVAAAVTAGQGPQGPQGPQGAPGDAISAASDVQLAGLAEGDVLRYSTNKWRNYADKNLVDGGNF